MISIENAIETVKRDINENISDQLISKLVGYL